MIVRHRPKTRLNVLVAKDKPDVPAAPTAPVNTSTDLMAGFDIPKTIGSLAEFRKIDRQFRKHVLNYVKG